MSSQTSPNQFKSYDCCFSTAAEYVDNEADVTIISVRLAYNDPGDVELTLEPRKARSELRWRVRRQRRGKRKAITGQSQLHCPERHLVW